MLTPRPSPAVRALDMLSGALGVLAAGLVIATAINLVALTLADIATARCTEDRAVLMLAEAILKEALA